MEVKAALPGQDKVMRDARAPCRLVLGLWSEIADHVEPLRALGPRHSHLLKCRTELAHPSVLVSLRIPDLEDDDEVVPSGADMRPIRDASGGQTLWAKWTRQTGQTVNRVTCWAARLFDEPAWATPNAPSNEKSGEPARAVATPPSVSAALGTLRELLTPRVAHSSASLMLRTPMAGLVRRELLLLSHR